MARISPQQNMAIRSKGKADRKQASSTPALRSEGLSTPRKPQDFAFINMSDDLAIDKTSRLAIRSQATRDFYRKAREREVSHASHHTPPAVVGQQLLRFRLGPGSLRPALGKAGRRQKRCGAEEQPRKVVSSLSTAGGQPPDDSDTDRSTLLLDVFERQRLIERFFDSNLADTSLQQLWQLTKAPAPRSPSSSSLDPFDTLPVQSSPRLLYLLHGCEGSFPVNVMSPVTTPNSLPTLQQWEVDCRRVLTHCHLL